MSNPILKNSLFQISGNFLRYFIQIARVAIIARYVLPEHYGLVASIQGVIGLSTILGDFGLTTAALQKKELSANHAKAFFWFNVMIGFLVVIILILVAPLIGVYLKNSDATKVVYVLSFNYLLISIYSQALVKMKRELQFKTVTIVEIASTVLSSFIGIYMAIHGYKYWTLIYMQLSESLFLMFSYLILAKLKIGLFKMNGEIWQSIKFGMSVNIMNILNRFTKSADTVLLGRFAGLTTTGFYSRAIMLTNIINVQLRGSVFAVSFPVMSKNQADDIEFYKSTYETYSILVFFNCWLGGALFWFADKIIPVYLGNGWNDVVPLLRILCLSLVFVPFNTINDQIPLAKGNALFYNKIGIIKNSIRLSLLIPGAILYGAVGCAAGLVIGELISSFVIYFLLRNKYQINVKLLVISILIPLSIALLSGALCFALGTTMHKPIRSLIILLTIFSIAYIVSYYLINFKNFVKITLKWRRN